MELENHEKQKIEDGYGAAYHRIYTIRVPIAIDASREELRKLKADLNHYSLHLLARFEKLSGSATQLAPGDEFQIHISGPWNGPVRVSEVTENAFGLITLQDHFEAGRIDFRILPGPDGKHSFFQIESLARSRDSVVDFVYDKLPIAKVAQALMWTAFCEKFAKEATENTGDCATEVYEVKIQTERRNEKTSLWEEA